MTRSRDPRPWFRITIGMPDHPKVEALSDAAFRLLIRCWDRSADFKTDGHITEAWWTKQKPKARRELIDAGLAEVVPEGRGVIMHDYEKHQRLRAEIEAADHAKTTAGALGAHNRWHEGKTYDPKCAICVANHPDGQAMPSG